MSTILKTVHKISLVGFFIIPVIMILSSCSCGVLFPYVKDVMSPLVWIVLATYFGTDSLAISLFRGIKTRITTRIENKKEREKRLDVLLNEHQELSEKLRSVEQELTEMKTEDAETERFVHEFIKKRGIEFVTREEMKSFMRLLDQRFKKIEENNTNNINQESISEENISNSNNKFKPVV